MNAFATANTQDDAKRPGFNPQSLLERIHRLLQERQRPVLLIAASDFVLVETDRILPVGTAPDSPRLAVTVLPAFQESIVPEEAARLYLIRIAP
jgi:hypothetical protein